MAGLSKVCPQLEQVWGGEDCWGEGADEKNRWRKVLDSGCREGREVRRTWFKILAEAHSCMNFLEEEMPEVLATPLPGLGNGSLREAGWWRPESKCKQKFSTKCLKV